MKRLIFLPALLALALVIVPPLTFQFGWLRDERLMKSFMLGGTLLWFISAPFWLRSLRESTNR